ncbi:hypothetical protein ABIE65_001281 [Constrictibacter sp. MBR-5]|jgi:hypothetical protein|uniref:DUF2290 domain-containing protein n=1 Tax=Constrictibacter sp. MBR-5 TaxID=3156467 RepID=UPI00339600C2
MNKKDVVSGILKTWQVSESLGIAQSFSNPSPLVASEAFIGAARSAQLDYESLYLEGLKYSDYNIILYDFSYFQFSWSEDSHVRFAFYPNPFLGAQADHVRELQELREFQDEGVIDFEEYLHRASELRRPGHPPLLRYENSPAQYVEISHPCSHFHFGYHSENRWAVRRELTAFAFGLICLRHFYADTWFGARSMKLFGIEGVPNEFLTSEKSRCRILPDTLFTATEDRHFSWS